MRHRFERKSLLIAVSFFLTVIFSPLGYAEYRFLKNEDSIEVKLIASTQSKREFDRIVEQIELKNTHRVACEIQLQENLIPTSCYEYLRVRDRFLSPSKNNRRKELAEIDSLCLKIAKKTRQTEVFYSDRLPTACARLAEASVKINRYKYGHDI